MKRRFISVLTAVAAVISALLMSSCGDSTPTVMSLGSHRVTAAMYHYWASSCKGYYINDYEDVTNTDECWNREFAEGESFADYFDGVTLDNVKTTLVTMKLFDDYGLALTPDEKQSISDYIEDLIKERADGSKNMMNSMLAEYGVNLSLLEDIYMHEAKGARVYDYLYGENGTEALDDEALDEFYRDSYVHINMIYINDAYQYVKDADGNMATDDNGYYKTEPLEESAAAEKKKAVEDVQKRLSAGEDFEVLFNEYDEMKVRMDYYYTASAAYNDALYYEIVAKASSMEENETATVSSDMGTCIIQKLPLGDRAWDDKEYESFFSADSDNTFRDNASQFALQSKIAEYYDDIEVDEEAIKAYSVKDVTPCYFF